MAFFQDSRPSREPFLNAHPAVVWLIGVMLAAHAVRVLLPGAWPEDILDDYAFTPVRFDALLHGASVGLFSLAVSFITYMFLHADITHVGINSLWLLAFGPIVARRLGTVKFLLFFFFCGIAAALLHLAAYWGSTMEVVGASGGVSGLMGGGIRILYGRVYGHRGLAPIASKSIMAFSLVWIIGNIAGGLLNLGVSSDVALIAWVAHLGGYFAGLTTIGFFDRLSLGAPGSRLA
jgi:membrane associated rhomboid family serine protease